MASRATVGVGLGEVRRVGVHIQDHVGCVELYRHVGMSGEIVEELFAFFHCQFGAFGLFASNGAEGHEDSEVDGPGIIKNASNDALDLFNVLWQKRGGCVRFNWALGSCAILFWLRVEWAMLLASGGCMFVLL
jgi:hypothetical protein